jgi:hypothetical protein
MRKLNPQFGDELQTLKDEVNNDVGEILKLAKSHAAPKIVPTSTKSSVITKIAVDQRESQEELKMRPVKPTTLPADQHVERHQTRQNITTRVCQQTNELLSEAALRQKLKKLKPDSRQDIIETALFEWFQRNLYHHASNDTD